MKCWLQLTLLLCLTAAGLRPTRAEPQVVNGLAAVVNDKIITYEDVLRAVNPGEVDAIRLRFARQPQAFAQEVARLHQAALVGLIERELILNSFHALGYQLPKTVLEEQVKDRIREEYGDRSRLMLSLQAQGVSIEEWTDRIRDQFIVSVMTTKYVSSAVLISPYKIETYYQEHLDQFQVKERIKLRMISLWTRVDRDLAATRTLADQVHEQIVRGSAFAELAQQYSDDPHRRDGGLRGWVEKGGTELRQDLQDYAFALEPGKVSDVYERPEGFYLMLVEEHQDAHAESLSDARDQIEAILRQRERDRLRKEWIEGLREKAFVRTFAPQ